MTYPIGTKVKIIKKLYDSCINKEVHIGDIGTIISNVVYTVDSNKPWYKLQIRDFKWDVWADCLAPYKKIKLEFNTVNLRSIVNS